jgi:hypothetical protein
VTTTIGKGVVAQVGSDSAIATTEVPGDMQVVNQGKGGFE